MIEIIGKSKALMGTWFYVKQYKLLLDAGDGAASTLGIWNDDVYTIAITHGHLDHLAGVIGVAGFQRRTRRRDKSKPKLRVIFHPGFAREVLKFRDLMADFGIRPDFQPIQEGEKVELKKGAYLQPFAVDHTASYYKTPLVAMGYHIIEKRKRLKPELATMQKTMSAQAFGQLMIDMKKKGKHESDLMEAYDYKVLSYIGDGKPMKAEAVQDTGILMHEVTFLDQEEFDGAHSHLNPVLDLAKQARVKNLLLYHFTEKYIRERKGYKKEVMTRAKERGVHLPIAICGVNELFKEKFDV